MALKKFKSSVPNQLWDEIKVLHDKSMSIQKIIDQIKEKHQVALGHHSVRKLTKYFDFKEVEDIPTFSQNNKSSTSTKDSPNRENYIGWIKDKLLIIAQTSFESQKHDLFFKATDRLINIYKIEKPLEVVQNLVEPDYGKSVLEAELKKLIKQQPIRTQTTSD